MPAKKPGASAPLTFDAYARAILRALEDARVENVTETTGLTEDLGLDSLGVQTVVAVSEVLAGSVDLAEPQIGEVELVTLGDAHQLYTALWTRAHALGPQ